MTMRILLLILLCGTSLHAQEVRKVLFVDTETVFNEQDAIKSVLKDLNWLRVKRGMLPLAYREEHQEKTSKWAVELSKKYRHSAAQFKAETICRVGHTPDQIMLSFMDSPPHKKSLMDRMAKGACIGIYYEPASIVQKGAHTISSAAIYYAVIRTY